MTKTSLFALLAALASATAFAADPVQIERGKYLVTIGGCHDCHTPLMNTAQGPVPDFSRALSGHPQGLTLPPPPAAVGPWVWGGAGTNTAFWGPWGISYSSNITSDKETGIGTWREEDFIAMARSGRHLGVGRPILPPMPWPALSAMTDDDLKAMYAYLQSTRAIKNAVPDAVINLPPALK